MKKQPVRKGTRQGQKPPVGGKGSRRKVAAPVLSPWEDEAG